MAIYFSEKFKNFRKTHSLTQEQVADIFNISSKAVSRWETGATYPDIEILPSLADLFGVTVDDLLGVDIAKKKLRIKEFLNKMDDAVERQYIDGKLCNENAIDEHIEICRNALQEFPNILFLLYRLAGSLWDKMVYCKDAGREDEMKKYAEEAIKFHERIISESNHYISLPFLEDDYDHTHGNFHYASILDIAYIYKVIDETDKAIEWANKLPTMECTSEKVLSRILKGDEKIKKIKKNIWNYSSNLRDQLDYLIEHEYNNLNVPEKIKCFQTVIAELEKYAEKGM